MRSLMWPQHWCPLYYVGLLFGLGMGAFWYLGSLSEEFWYFGETES